MKWTWIDLEFPWIGLAAALIVLGLLLFTNLLRGNLTDPRWRDRTWLAWLAVVLYLLHNVEEYGIDLLGQHHAFPGSMCATLGQPPYPMCTIPPAFYLAVNLPLFWIGAPAAALMSRRHPIVGLCCYGIIFINGMAHVGASLRSGYNPGLLTALILFLPVSVWVAKACFGRGRLRYGGLALIVADGVLLHAILIGSAILFLHGVIGPLTLTAIEVANAALCLLLAWLAEQWRDSWLLQPEPMATTASEA